MKKPYVMLFWMGLINFVIMFALMYSMVVNWGDATFSLNKAYMAITMVAPMMIVMPLMMSEMFKDSRLNGIIIVTSAVALIVFLTFVRKQTLIGDKAFLSSMIPHHSGAILMCNEADIRDQEIKDLCQQIIKSQRDEIEQMQKIKERLAGS